MTRNYYFIINYKIR